MNGNSIVNLLNTIFKWITRLAMVNIMWILYSIMGLVIVGIFPSTIATLSISRKWLIGKRDINLFKTFNRSFKKNFLISNIVGWLLTIFGSILYVNYKIMISMSGELLIISIFAFYLLLFFYLQLLIWVFPIIIHYNGTVYQHIKNAIIIGTGKIHLTIASALWLFIVLYLTLSYPASLIFSSISIGSVGWVWISLKAFNKLDNKSK